MKYRIENGKYIADEGHVFKDKDGYMFSSLTLAVNDSIDNYEVIEKPAEPEADEVSDSEALNELLEVIDDES